jgi:hypothetical protein
MKKYIYFGLNDRDQVSCIVLVDVDKEIQYCGNNIIGDRQIRLLITSPKPIHDFFSNKHVYIYIYNNDIFNKMLSINFQSIRSKQYREVLEFLQLQEQLL